RRTRYRLIATAAVLAAAAAVALVVKAPGGGGPTILDKASAALTAPAGKVIYESTRFPATGPLCLSTQLIRPNQPPCVNAFFVRTQLWLEGGTAVRTFRTLTKLDLPRAAVGSKATLSPFGNAFDVIRSRHVVLETGGTIEGSHVRDVLVHIG